MTLILNRAVGVIVTVIVMMAFFLPDSLATPVETLTIIAGGDVMLGSWVESPIREKGYHYPFVHLDSILTDADVMFVNLEAPFGQGDSAFNKTYTFRVPPDLVGVLTAGRINTVSLANNHILDYGAGALQETMEVLSRHQITFSGAGMNLGQARKPAYLTSRGRKIAVVSYSLTFPEEFWATDSAAGTCFPSHTFLYRDLKALRQECDLLIVSFHWGAELMETPKEYQVDLAHRAIRAGADLILGHHPHVIQGLEIYQGKLIAYSLGNYIFGSYSESVKYSMLLKMEMGKEGIERFRVIPLNVYNRVVDFQPRPLQGEEQDLFFKKLTELSLELNRQPFVVKNAGWTEL